MASVARYPVQAFKHFVFLCALCAWSAPPGRAEAGFQLTLDADSVRTIGDHYAIDVLLSAVGEPPFEIIGIIATVKSPDPGLVFLRIAPSANGSIFDAEANWPDDSPSNGDAEERWLSSVSVPPAEKLQVPGSSIAYQLEFSVPSDGAYTIEFVNSDAPDSDDLTFYFYPVGESFDIGYFEAFPSSTFVVSTPEPSSLALLTVALGGLGVGRRRALRRRKATEGGLLRPNEF